MYYRINVALNGQHFFATAENSITNMDKLHRVYSEIVRAFPASAGYTVDVTRWETRGTPVNVVVPATTGQV